MKLFAVTTALSVAALLAGCNQKANTASPGVIDTPACCSDKSDCKPADCAGKKAKTSCTQAAASTSACCASKKK
ncbi:MAG: hypothetical protein MK100_01370 [Phycisphaerales bacterium]|nr:hypothetical protein [Phycisphaerales bacterium]